MSSEEGFRPREAFGAVSGGWEAVDAKDSGW